MKAVRFLLATFLIFLCANAYGRKIDLLKEAPGLVANVEDALRAAAPKFKRNIAGKEFALSIDPGVQEASFDTENAIATLKASVRYYTSDESVLNQARLGISVTVKVETAYNTAKNELTTLKVSFGLPRGWGDGTIELKGIMDVFDGDLVSALDVIPNGGLVKRKSESEYDSQKARYVAKYGKNNVYFASSDFVRWASPATAGRWVATLVTTGGGASSTIEAEARDKAKEEFAHIAAWLKQVGVSNTTRTAEALLAGRPISHPKLSLVWQTVRYKSQLIIVDQELPEITTNHLAFVLVWGDRNTIHPKSFPSNGTLSSDNTARLKWRLGIRYAMGPSGSRVIFLSDGGPAKKAGLRVDDLITEVGGVSVKANATDSDPMLDVIKKTKNQVVTFKFERNGSTKNIPVKLEPKLD